MSPILVCSFSSVHDDDDLLRSQDGNRDYRDDCLVWGVMICLGKEERSHVLH